MKAYLHDSVLWTPERGGLSADGELAEFCRFSRTCAAVFERIRSLDAKTPVVVGTATGADAPVGRVVDELESRWTRGGVRLVCAGAETVPASLIEALIRLQAGDEVTWGIVDLKPGAELVGAFVLSNLPRSRTLRLTREHESQPPPAEHLNPCAAVLSLADPAVRETVSIKVGSWSLALGPSS